MTEGVLAAVFRRGDQQPDAPAVSDGETCLSCRELARAVTQTASLLAASCPGETPVALALDNGPAWVVIDLALAHLGRPSLPLPPFFSPKQRRHALADAGAGVLIGDRAPDAGAPLAPFRVAGRLLYLRALDNAPRSLPAETAKITYTSGTTSQPKGVCLSQAAMEQVAQSLLAVIGADYAGTHFAVLPLAVLLENVAGLYTTLLAGGHYHVRGQAAIGFAPGQPPEVARLVALLHETGATSAILVPEILRGVLAALSAGMARPAALKLVAVGGSALPPGLLDEAARWGLPVFQGYGLSEAASVVALNTPACNRPGSVGRVLPHLALFLDKDGEIVLARAPFLGYVGGPAPERSFRTSDLGHIDEHGQLTITGRKKNMIITTQGRNIAPEWVEGALLSQPAIGQAVVFGDAEPALMALLVPAGAAVSAQDLARAVVTANADLPSYAQIRHWRQVAPFTCHNGQLTGTGRPRRSIIQEAYKTMIEKTYRPAGGEISFFNRLVAESKAEREHLYATPQIRDGLAGRISRETYLAYLGEAYHHVKHTVPLMELAKAKLPPHKAWLVEALDHYIAEEKGHEAWILDDIRNAGGDAPAVRAGAPLPATEFMVAYAYDFINRINPVGFFGMVLVLEGTSIQLALQGAEAVKQALDLPDDCFRYLTSHGVLDVDHMAFFENLMARIDDPGDQAAILHMARRMYLLFAGVFRSIPHDSEQQHAA